MIISASRRTDIPAFYAEWFNTRIKKGYCAVPNPFNRKQVSYVPLTPESVDVIVFWTRNPKPLLPHLQELDDRGFRYYFQFTILDYPQLLDPKSPGLNASLAVFKELADRIGPERMIWRYDPLVFSRKTPYKFHLQTFSKIAAALEGSTKRSVISVMDFYRKAQSRFNTLEEQGLEILPVDPREEAFTDLIRDLLETSGKHRMELVSCAEKLDLVRLGVRPGKCIDDQLIDEVFDHPVSSTKDPYQREQCGCVQSKDIGMYDSCLYGCQYCYATRSFERARKNYQEHDPESPSLLGWYDAEPPEPKSQMKMFDE
jgi:hypothetical protein